MAVISKELSYVGRLVDGAAEGSAKAVAGAAAGASVADSAVATASTLDPASGAGFLAPRDVAALLAARFVTLVPVGSTLFGSRPGPHQATIPTFRLQCGVRQVMHGSACAS